MQLTVQEIILLGISVFNILIGLFVLIKEPRRLVNRAFAIVTFGIFIWGASIVMIIQTEAFAWSTLIIYGFVILLFGFVLFARVFPRTTHVPRKFYLVFTPLLLIIASAPFNFIIQGAIFHEAGNPEPVNGILFPLFAFISIGYIIFGLVLFIRTYRRARGHARLQANYLLFGLSVFLMSAFICNVFLPMLGIFRFNLLGPISSIMLTGAAAYAIVRHQLLDIRIVIQRGLIYLILLGAIVGIYITELQSITILLHRTTDMNVLVSAGLTMVLGILFFEPVKNYFQKVTDPIFFKDTYSYPDALHTLSKILNTNINRTDIISASTAALENIFKTTRVIFRQASEELAGAEEKESGIVLTIPVMFEDRSVGVFGLPPKRSGDSYSPRDITLLETFAYQAAVALEKGRLYEEVEKYSSKLEQLVSERTQKIQKLQEEQKQSMIDISHNLQTPLAIIKSELDFLTDSSSDQEKMRIVSKSLVRVSEFIRQLLHLARLEGSAHEVKFESINISALLSAQIEYFEVVAHESTVAITSKILPGKTIRGNKRLLEELFINLVVNAIKYRRQNIQSTIHISLTEEAGALVIRVRDNGVGIAPKDLPEIFTRFYRAERAIEGPQGSGLGLAIAKSIVEKHGGTIAVISTLGHGTEFTIAFPY